LPDVIGQVEKDGIRVVMSRDGEPVAPLVSIDDLHALKERDRAQDAYWERAADEAEGQPPGISHEDLVRELGIDHTETP
jgi:hypothetical protein